MNFIDMHCDSLMKLYFHPEETDLFNSRVTSVDFARMKAGGQLAQFFAVFLPTSEMFEYSGIKVPSDEEYIAALRNYLLTNVENHADLIAMAYGAGDIVENQRNGKMSAILTMEDGRAVDGKLENLKRYYDLGFRAISLTWNGKNCFGSPNSKDPDIMRAGLTDFGKEAVAYMQEIGILVDVSHLSEGGFYDVADICRKPFAATHSNSFSLSPHQRNLTDDQLRVLGNAGGVAGLNFAPEFLNEEPGNKNSTAAMLAKHARHMANVGGIDCVGIGSDLDGISGELEISDSSQFGILIDRLQKEKFTESEIDKICHKNVLRVMKDAVK
ncbi:MAG: membrane dipeptidase [Coprococcus sp.]|nr:membrane dipeptidase [Coprococcus sp.]